MNARNRTRYNGLTPYQQSIAWLNKEIEKYEKQKTGQQGAVDHDNSANKRWWPKARRANMFRLVASGGQLSALKRALCFLDRHPYA